jgi:hypothetical protein
MEKDNFVMWIDPKHEETFSNSPAALIEQKRHIRKHGDGPFKVTKLIPICGGEMVEFKDQNSQLIQVNTTWLFIPPPFCPRIFTH